MTHALGPQQSHPGNNHAQRSSKRSGDLVFIHGFQDTAALWQQVIECLAYPNGRRSQ